MILVQNTHSELFTSNVYLVTSPHKRDVFLIDCGAFESVQSILSPNMLIKGIFLTHYHYDHIYFIKDWIKKYPDVKFYCSQITFEGLSNSKRNLSFYHENPIEINNINYLIVNESSIINLFDNVEIRILETEGHCEGSLTFLIGKYIFTGDALIPNIPVVTKLKTGDKEKAKTSVKKIRSIGHDDCVICPGHLETTLYHNVDWDLYFND